MSKSKSAQELYETRMARNILGSGNADARKMAAEQEIYRSLDLEKISALMAKKMRRRSS